MSNYQPTQQQVNHFWDRFLQRAYKQGVTKPTDRWYVIRAEEYIKAFPGKRLADHRATNVNGYLEELGRKTSLEDWLFGQTVDAIKILFRWCRLNGSIRLIGLAERRRLNPWLTIIRASRAMYPPPTVLERARNNFLQTSTNYPKLNSFFGHIELWFCLVCINRRRAEREAVPP